MAVEDGCVMTNPLLLRYTMPIVTVVRAVASVRLSASEDLSEPSECCLQFFRAGHGICDLLFNELTKALPEAKNCNADGTGCHSQILRRGGELAVRGIPCEVFL